MPAPPAAFPHGPPIQATLQRMLPTQPGVSRETPFASSPVQLLARGGRSCQGRQLGPRGRGTGATGSPQEAYSSGDPAAWLAPYRTLLCSSPRPPQKLVAQPGTAASHASPVCPRVRPRVTPSSAPRLGGGAGVSYEGSRQIKTRGLRAALSVGGLGQGPVLRLAECGGASAGPVTKVMLDQIKSGVPPGSRLFRVIQEVGGFCMKCSKY